MWEWTTDHGLPRVVIDCDSKAAADDIRARWPDALADADDARQSTVVVSGDVRDRWLREIEQLASERGTDAVGQRPLTPAEKDRLDFAETSVFHAEACKALARSQGVDDWLGWYDPTLSVAEHHEVYRRPSASAPTCREMPRPQFRGVVRS